MIPTPAQHRFGPLAVILAAFVVLALVYAWATPPLEASDELWHFGLIDHLANTGSLPVQTPGVETAWEQEGSQPPLYYLIAAALVKPIDRADFDALRQPNPHAKAGVPGASDNKNLVLHDAPHPALVGTALAVAILRFFGLLLGGVTVAAVYATALHVSSSRRVAVVAAALTAFNPMFLFISASVNNDNLVTALGSLALWQTVVLLRDGFSPRRSLWLALLLACAALTKLSGLVLVPVVGLAALWVAYRGHNGRGFIVLVGLTAIAGLLIAGWWYARNLTLYHELFGTTTMVAVAGPRTAPFTLQTLVDEFEGFRIAYWGWFGAVDILTFAPYYPLMDALTVVALVGLALFIAQTRGRRLNVWMLALAVLVGMIGVIGWTAQTYASQGRLLFPYVAAISTLLALGLDELFGRIRLRRLESVLAGAYGVFALIVALVSIAPVYAPPSPLAALPSSATPVFARFGDVELVGYETADVRYQPGDDLPMTIYWRVVQPSSRDLSLYLHAIDPSGAVLGRIDSFPGAGRLRTSTWQAGAIYADSYRIPLDRGAVGRFPLTVQVGWWHYASRAVIGPVDQSGAPLPSVILNAGGFVGGPSSDLPADLTPTERVTFGNVIALTGYKLDGDHLTLAWEATGTPQDSDTVFVQVLDSAGKQVGQGDAPPDLPTRYWRSGERYVTTHTISYPTPPAPGSYQIVVGWYLPSGDFPRLGAPYPNSAYMLTKIEK